MHGNHGFIFGETYGMEKGGWRTPPGCGAWQQMVEVYISTSHRLRTSSADCIL